jgi:hypothetical protein
VQLRADGRVTDAELDELKQAFVERFDRLGELVQEQLGQMPEKDEAAPQ